MRQYPPQFAVAASFSESSNVFVFFVYGGGTVGGRVGVVKCNGIDVRVPVGGKCAVAVAEGPGGIRRGRAAYRACAAFGPA